MAVIHINTADLREKLSAIRVGDEVYLTGTVYTARDAAHKRIRALLEAGEPLPFDLDGAVIYYAGPTPERPGRPIGSCGPTTSSRMDVYTPLFLEHGLCAMIGKGPRSREVVDAIVKNGAAYFCAIGGAGALVRWMGAEGIIYPDGFISLFEKNGFIISWTFGCSKSFASASGRGSTPGCPR